jgi:cobalt/nickel transport system permease protein
MDLDRYLERSSPLHRADARVKFLVTLGFIFSISLLPIASFVALAGAWLLVVAASLIARVGPVRVIRGAFVATPFFFAALPLVITRPGDPIGSLDLGLFTITFSGEGLRMFGTIALKSWISVQAAVLLTFSTRFVDLVEALRQLRLPPIMVGVISFMYRYLAVLTDEATTMLRARSARSAQVSGHGGGSVVWRARVVGHMVGSLFLRAYERSERVYAAMQSRGFTGEFRRLEGRTLATTDYATLALAATLFATFTLAARLWMPHA